MRTISSWWVSAMAETFKWHGLPVTTLFNDANIALDSLTVKDSRYPQSNVSSLWNSAQAAIERRGELLNLGIAVGGSMNVRAIPVIGLALLKQDSVLSAFKLILRYQKLIGDTTNAQLIEPQPWQAQLRFHFASNTGAIGTQSYEAAMAFCVKIARTVAGKQWRPTRVSVQRQEPCEQLQQYFNCAIEYGASSHQIHFQADAQIEHAQLQQGIVAEKHKAISQVLILLLEQQLASGELSCKTMAQMLSMSEKTLQRRLSAEGTSYRTVLDTLRQEKSCALLQESTLSLSEIAYLCGYSELSAFHHAFKRWFAVSPSQYRNEKPSLYVPQEEIIYGEETLVE
ncbi:AraC family transcriptional regulator [Pseudoalteromonas sp. BDTF-M6]|uniref:AraC family transcriptional regulator n=1 Tax=Pseudoalteromonas sp. BDTF-M6 TaxID=2796132 RepID=UPI001BAF49FD|nr:AraC family transcriptional regulator [Pseudoalteromonas sp. BDTF-M6]MBS3798196.1 AraC family transcriptional regulator ligand-binding domain-containing protein [Pseudoalteromonas sp. BDTF-M6]